MCWRDDVRMNRHCSACGQPYYGDLGHRNCPGRKAPQAEQKPTPPAEKPKKEVDDDVPF